MSKARLIITAVVLEGRSQADVARSYGVSQAWVSRLVARYRTEGDAAFEPRSRRPNTRPNQTPTETVDLVGARSYFGGDVDATAFATVFREICSRSAICDFGTPSAANLRINAQSSKVITLQSLSAHFSTGKGAQFSAVIDSLWDSSVCAHGEKCQRLGRKPTLLQSDGRNKRCD